MNTETQKKRKLYSSPQLFNDSASDCSSSKDDSQFPYARVEVISEPNPKRQCRSPFSAYPRFNRVLTPQPATESNSNRLHSSPFNQSLKQEVGSVSSSSTVCYSQLSFGNVVFITACVECDKMHMPTDGDDESKPLMSELMAQLSCKEESTSTTNLEGASSIATEGSFDLWNNNVHEQGETISRSLRKLNQQNLQQMELANKLKIAFDSTSDEVM